MEPSVPTRLTLKRSGERRNKRMELARSAPATGAAALVSRSAVLGSRAVNSDSA